VKPDTRQQSKIQLETAALMMRTTLIRIVFVSGSVGATSYPDKHKAFDALYVRREHVQRVIAIRPADI